MTHGPEAAFRLAAEAHARAVAGEPQMAQAALRSLEASRDPSARAWSAALSVQIWFTAPALGALPETTLLHELSAHDASVRFPALLAAADVAIARLVRFEAPLLPPLVAAPESLAQGLDDGARARVELLGAASKLVAGEDDAALALSTDAAARASLAQVPSVVVEATALRSLACGDDVGAGLALARRASLMGRSEGIPHAEFLAHIALVRARRRAGQPHLGLRITSALRGVVTAPWLPWLDWETSWAGGSPPPLPKGADDPAASAVRALGKLLDAAVAGDRAGYAAAAVSIHGACCGMRLLERELSDLTACLDVADHGGTPAATEFRSGARTLTPPSLHGFRLRARGRSDGETAGAYVYRSRDGSATRILHWGVNLLGDPTFVRVKQSHRTEGRIETLLAVLALAGPGGIEDAPCFEAAYGFRYVAELHRGVFDVLLHRTRAAIDGIAEIVRDSGRLSLRTDRALLVPDPRVSERTQDRILRYLAEQGAASARDAAERLGVSLRAAQGALKELSSAGACQLRRDGRNVEYVVEDTVFSEPTRRLSVESLTALAGGGAGAPPTH